MKSVNNSCFDNSCAGIIQIRFMGVFSAILIWFKIAPQKTPEINILLQGYKTMVFPTILVSFSSTPLLSRPNKPRKIHV
jgi:hypothetical protein